MQEDEANKMPIEKEGYEAWEKTQEKMTPTDAEIRQAIDTLNDIAGFQIIQQNDDLSDILL